MMKNSKFNPARLLPLVWVVGGALGFGFFVAPRVASAPVDPSRMNLLLIQVEDWSTAGLGCYGNPVVQTPNLDRLAARGIRFNRAYAQATVCNPSRSSFATGLRPDSTRVYGNVDSPDQLLPAGVPFLADVLGSPDVYSACFGKLMHKWNEAGRFTHGYDLIEYTHDYDRPEGFSGEARVSPVPSGGPEDTEWECLFLPNPEVVERLRELRQERDARLAAGAVDNWELRKPFQQLLAEQVGDSGLLEEQMEDGRLVRSAAGLLGQLAADGQRFFLTVGLYAPHTPLLAPRKYVEMYDPADLPLTEAPVENDQGVPALARRNGANYDLFNGLYPEYGPSPERQREARAAYYACSSYVDAQIGILLDALQQNGLEDNTMVVFFSDHGFHLGEHGCWSKFTLFEQSIRVPLVVYVPGVQANGQVCDAIVELVDVFPTLCDLWGKEKSPRFEGLSFAPLLENPKQPWKKAAFSMVPLSSPGRSVRTPRYRYAEYRKTAALASSSNEVVAVEFYDLENDPWEQHNLARDPAHAEEMQRHRQLLNEGWQAALP